MPARVRCKDSASEHLTPPFICLAGTGYSARTCQRQNYSRQCEPDILAVVKCHNRNRNGHEF